MDESEGGVVLNAPLRELEGGLVLPVALSPSGLDGLSRVVVAVLSE